MVSADTSIPPVTVPPTVVVLMGPAGSGKSLVGTRLAVALGWPFYEGDAYHPPANVARMHAGIPLTDADRAPWLAALATIIARAVAADAPAVLACSALKHAYRGALVPAGAPAGAVRFVYLRADPALLANRLAGRPGHFFAPALLASQIATLELPDDAEPAPVLTVDAAHAPDGLVGEIRRAFSV
ncbi:gluconokinase [Gemmatimonadetes bacterium T265]|nr:gluconokinase [Gemmatimonadetes bacterium T265]